MPFVLEGKKVQIIITVYWDYALSMLGARHFPLLCIESHINSAR